MIIVSSRRFPGSSKPVNDSCSVHVIHCRHDLSHKLPNFTFIKLPFLVDILHQLATWNGNYDVQLISTGFNLDPVTTGPRAISY